METQLRFAQLLREDERDGFAKFIKASDRVLGSMKRGFRDAKRHSGDMTLMCRDM